MRRFALIVGLVSMIALVTFVLYKSAVVASELVDPPFYKPQPVQRVDATFAALAAGGAGDPGGTWSKEETNGLELWTLTRRGARRGHVLLLHGFGDDRWGTSPALRWFPDLDASIFTYRRRDDVLRRGAHVPVTFGAVEHQEVVAMVHTLEKRGVPRKRIILMGRSLGASVALLALSRLEQEGDPLGGVIWEGAPRSSLDFGERLVRGPQDRLWHACLAPAIGALGGRLAAWKGGYSPKDTDVLHALEGRTLRTPSLAFLATEDRLAPLWVQREAAQHFQDTTQIEVTTWHLNCSAVLGPTYGARMRAWYTTRLPAMEEP